MNPDYLTVGDYATESPKGPGQVSDFTNVNGIDYPIINGSACAWCLRADGKVYNPTGLGARANDLSGVRRASPAAAPTPAPVPAPPPEPVLSAPEPAPAPAPAPYASGGAGDFSGGGASGSWDSRPSSSDTDSSSSSSGSDSGSSSSSD